MGCAPSTPVQTEEVLARCKDRKQLMKAAVSSRNAFAAAHSAYATALKNTGAALSDYALAAAAAVDPSSDVGARRPPTSPPRFRSPPPPPPPPNFAPLYRSASMPDLHVRKRKAKKPSAGGDVIREEDDGAGGGRDAAAADPPVAVPPPPLPPHRDQPSPPPLEDDKEKTPWDYFFFTQSSSLGAEEPRGDSPRREDGIQSDTLASASVPSSSAGGGAVDSNTRATLKKDVADAPPPTTEKEQPKPSKELKQVGPSVHHRRAATVEASDAKRGKAGGSTTSASSVSLTGMLIELDNHFLKCFEGAATVSKMLEASRFHYHSNFADNQGYIDHSARVMQVITWTKSSRRAPASDDARDEFNEESETHVTILDKLLAWEKKLYKEVKASELTKNDYQRKMAKLDRQREHGAKHDTLEKTKAVASHSRTRYIIDKQSLDSTVSEIQWLRDHQLYPILTMLVDGMTKMWETMLAHHESQQKIVTDIQSLDISGAPKETSQQLYDRTAQLHRIASEWHSQFQKLVNHQKDYVRSVNSWLQLNFIPVGSNSKEQASSPSLQGPQQPPIQILLRAWHEQLEKLPDDRAKNALYSFAAVIEAIIVRQQEELKHKERYELARQEYLRKEESFGYWLDKQNSRRKPAKETDGERSKNYSRKEQTEEKKLDVENLKKRAETEQDAYLNLCKQVREKSVASLKSHLPELFRAMSDFSFACATMYRNLRTISQTRNSTMAS